MGTDPESGTTLVALNKIWTIVRFVFHLNRLTMDSPRTLKTSVITHSSSNVADLFPLPVKKINNDIWSVVPWLKPVKIC